MQQLLSQIGKGFVTMWKTYTESKMTYGTNIKYNLGNQIISKCLAAYEIELSLSRTLSANDN
jgi:hypothetical protein